MLQREHKAASSRQGHLQRVHMWVAVDLDIADIDYTTPSSLVRSPTINETFTLIRLGYHALAFRPSENWFALFNVVIYA